MPRGTIKVSKRANSYLLDLSVKLSKKRRQRVYVTTLIDEVCERLKSGIWELDSAVE
jgi:hypothetical protein